MDAHHGPHNARMEKYVSMDKYVSMVYAVSNRNHPLETITITHRMLAAIVVVLPLSETLNNIRVHRDSPVSKVNAKQIIDAIKW
jgi:hypothetical protein